MFTAVDFIEIQFDSAIDPSSFATVMLSLPARKERCLESPQQLQPDTFRLNLQTPLTAGDFTVVVGPEIQDLAGNELAEAFTQPFSVELADLAVVAVTGPEQLIGDPAALTVSWTVQNVGTGRPASTTWDDAVILSTRRRVWQRRRPSRRQFQAHGRAASRGKL